MPPQEGTPKPADITAPASSNDIHPEATSNSEATAADLHRHRHRVRHRSRVPWYRKPRSRRTKVLLFIGAVLALLVAFALLHFLENPPTVPPPQ